MVHHCISTCKRIPNLAQIFLIGFYQEQEFALYVSSITNELKVPVRYLKEDKPHGSAAGLYYFRDMIQNCAVYYVVVLICAVIRENGEPLRCILITSISFGAVTYLSAELPQFFKNGELDANRRYGLATNTTCLPKKQVSRLIISNHNY